MSVHPDIAHPEEGGDSPSERSPLLWQRDTVEEAQPHSQKTKWQARAQNPLIILFIFLIFTEGSNFMQQAPMTKIMEFVICTNYYSQTEGSAISLSDQRCKIGAVQSELASIRGYQQLFDCLVSIAVAVPFGLLADRYSKKKVLMLAMGGLIAARVWIQAVCVFPRARFSGWMGLIIETGWWSDRFPLRMSWFSSLWLLLGGGNLVSGSLIYAIIADLTVAESRASTFLLTNVAVLGAEIITVPLGSALMDYSPWLPVNLSLGNVLLGTLLLALVQLPEANPEVMDHSGPVANELEGERGSTNEGNLLSRATKKLPTIPKEVWAMVIVSFVSNMDRTSQPFFMQYVSKRFEVSLSQANLLMSYRAIFNLLLLFILLPAMTRTCQSRFQLPAVAKDLWLARFSAATFLLGSLVMAQVPNLPMLCMGLTVFAMGYGLSALVHSLATALVNPRHIAVLFNAMSIAETIGDLIAGPLFSETFALGQRWGGKWSALFLDVMAGCYLVVAAGLWVISPRFDLGGEEEDEEGCP